MQRISFKIPSKIHSLQQKLNVFGYIFIFGTKSFQFIGYDKQMFV